MRISLSGDMRIARARRRRLPAATTLALAAAALLAACGGGDGGEQPPAAPGSGAGRSAQALAADASRNYASATANDTPVLTVRASGTQAGGVGPVMLVRLGGVTLGSAEVRSAELQDYAFAAPGLALGGKVDIVFTNDATVGGDDRNLTVAYVSTPTTILLPGADGVVFDRGVGEAAFDGADTVPGQTVMYVSGALRAAWPAPLSGGEGAQRRYKASRFLQQASFGATPADLEQVQSTSIKAWLDAQMAMPFTPDFVDNVQARFDRGAAYRPPAGSSYTSEWNEQKFWATAATAPDQLRKRVAFALHQILVTSLADSNLHDQARPFAHYLDNLGRHAFGNYRDLLEDVALSPVMGTYLSHIRNQKEDPATGRLPDENFARELMQLFTIGLHELNPDGSVRLDSRGQPIETYTNADVMALAKVFTGYSWGFDDAQLTEQNFRWGWPVYTTTGDKRIDLRKMKPYPGMSSTAEKKLFGGKPNAIHIAAGTSAAEGVRLALDGLFNHPNVGPFIGRQLIQRLVTSNPSPAYVARVASAFNNNGKGKRGDMAAVVRAVLMDAEARSPAAAPAPAKLREPVLRLTQWMRAFGARSASGNYTMGGDVQPLGQRALVSPSVFNFYRPGYLPPNTGLASAGLVAPEMQIVNESTTAIWVNQVGSLLYSGIGWNGSSVDVTTDLATETAIAATGPLNLIEHLNVLLFAGRMSPALRGNLLDAMSGIYDGSPTRDRSRALVAIYIAMSSPEYLVQP